jgi:hypothetical protein
MGEGAPSLLRRQCGHYVYALKTIAQLSLILKGQFDVAKKSEAIKFKLNTSRLPPEPLMDIEQRWSDWSDRDSGFVKLCNRLQEYWNILPGEAIRGKAIRRNRKAKARVNKPHKDGSSITSGKRKDPHTADSGRTSILNSITMSEPGLRGILGSKGSPEDLRLLVQEVYIEYQSPALEGLDAINEFDRCVDNLAAVAGKLGLVDDCLSALQKGALYLLLGHPATLTEDTVNTILGFFWLALTDELELPLSQPKYWSDVTEYMYAWRDRGESWPRHPEEKKWNEKQVALLRRQWL